MNVYELYAIHAHGEFHHILYVTTLCSVLYKLWWRHFPLLLLRIIYQVKCVQQILSLTEAFFWTLCYNVEYFFFGEWGVENFHFYVDFTFFFFSAFWYLLPLLSKDRQKGLKSIDLIGWHVEKVFLFLAKSKKFIYVECQLVGAFFHYTSIRLKKKINRECESKCITWHETDLRA